jgi:hypothetical protein
MKNRRPKTVHHRLVRVAGFTPIERGREIRRGKIAIEAIILKSIVCHDVYPPLQNFGFSAERWVERSWIALSSRLANSQSKAARYESGSGILIMAHLEAQSASNGSLACAAQPPRHLLLKKDF